MKGYPKAVFKKFKSEREANQFVGNMKWKREEKAKESKIQALNETNKKLGEKNRQLEEDKKDLAEETAFLKTQMEAEWARCQTLESLMSNAMAENKRLKFAIDLAELKTRQVKCEVTDSATSPYKSAAWVAEECSEECSCEECNF